MEKYIYDFLLLDNIKRETCFNSIYNQNIEIILNKLRKKIKKYTKKNCEIVVSKYNENLKWLDKYKNLATIYDKSDHPIEGSIKLVNVGRESHTYLYHIITNWNNLSENTFFTQGNLSKDHDPFPIETYLLKKKKLLFFSHFFCKGIKFRNNNKYLFFTGKWKNDFDNGNMKKSNLSFQDFWNQINSEIIEDYSQFKWSHGAIFSINRKLIKSKPIEYYMNLIKYVGHHCNPEEGHYFERCWYYIFFSQRYNYLLNNYFFFLNNVFYNTIDLNNLFLDKRNNIEICNQENNELFTEEINNLTDTIEDKTSIDNKIEKIDSKIEKIDNKIEKIDNKEINYYQKTINIYDNKNKQVQTSHDDILNKNLINNNESISLINFIKISDENKDNFNYNSIVNKYLNKK